MYICHLEFCKNWVQNGLKVSRDRMTQAIITKNAKMVADNIIVGVEDAILRKRLFVYANVIESVADFMSTIGFVVSTKESLYKNVLISERFDVADFYVGPARVDVRIMDNTTNAVLIPKSHKELGIEPDLYIVVKVDDSLKSLDVIGFIPTEQIIFDKEIQNFYVLNVKKLLPMDKFKQLSHSIQIKKYNLEISEKDIFQLLIKMQEEELSPKSQVMLLHTLLANLPFLKKLNKIQRIDTASSNLVDMPDLLEEFSPVFVEDFADDDLGGMDNIEEVEILGDFGDEQVIDVPQSEIDEVLDELNPDFGKEPVFEQMPKPENKPLILHVIVIILIGAGIIWFGLGKKEDKKPVEANKMNTINNAVIPTINPEVKSLTWGIASDLSGEAAFVNYLNETGQIAKERLSRKIQFTTEAPVEKELRLSVVFDNNAGFKSCIIKRSSGSKEIDNAALSITKEVFEEYPSKDIRTSEPFIRTVLIIKL